MSNFKKGLFLCCASAVAMIAVAATPAAASPFDITGPTAPGIDTPFSTDLNFNVAQTGTISSFGMRIALGCSGQCDGEFGASYWDNVQVTLSHGADSAIVFDLGTDQADFDGTLSATFQDGYALLTVGNVVGGGLTAGTFGPQDPFSVFLGKELSGTWTMSFMDTAGYPDDGTGLLSSSIFGTTRDLNAVPEPAAAGLLGLGLAGLALMRRRRSAGK